MRAMVLASADSSVQDHLALQELPAPQAAAGQVRLRVHACGVCHTDLHIVEGDLTLPRLPLV
ncbi:MAG: alcohol dehydrogenase catalytic domain-containing protein, partial [Anaerolineae bacterium]|nr:alcohol dehydrogenase catalytic domain-containing protein [Anaerolineae bacterium]